MNVVGSTAPSLLPKASSGESTPPLALLTLKLVPSPGGSSASATTSATAGRGVATGRPSAGVQSEERVACRVPVTSGHVWALRTREEARGNGDPGECFSDLLQCRLDA